MNEELKLVTYNIEMGKKPEAVVKNLKNFVSQGVQLFCLQEMREEYKGMSLKNFLLNELGPNWKAEYFLSMQDNFDFGLCTLWDASRLEPVSFEHLAFPILPKFKLWEKAVYLYRRQRRVPTQRGGLIGTFALDGKRLRVSNIHLDWQGSFQHRSTQLQFLKKHLDSQKETESEIICGDFNMLGVFSRNNHIKKLEGLLGTGFRSVLSKTYSTVRPYQQLDYVFIKGLEVQNAQVHTFSGSDHLPLLADLHVTSRP